MKTFMYEATSGILRRNESSSIFGTLRPLLNGKPDSVPQLGLWAFLDPVTTEPTKKIWSSIERMKWNW